MILMIGTAVPAYADETEGSQNGETTSASVPSEHVCSFTTETITTEATCTAPGIKTLSCGCGESKTEEIAAKGHDYKVSRLDDANHESVCSRCGDKATAAHSWNEGTVTTQANCQQAGVKTYTCTACGATKTEDIPKSSTHTVTTWTKVDGNSHQGRIRNAFVNSVNCVD